MLADRSAYGAAAALADGAHVHAAGEEAARRRRDLAVEGFHDLRRRFESGDRAALDDFYAAAVRLKSDRFDEWERRWRAGALASAERTGGHLAALRAGDLTHLRDAELHHRPAPAPGDRRLGMCGRLDVYDLT
ncbi:hypothetical protein [Actinomadura keratinilytica]|uniref:hypothetical protein n=1 Tax=Actinomadura keratinilytica TaxID=547461 RepID=UPI0036154C7F